MNTHTSCSEPHHLRKPFLHSTLKRYFFGILKAWDCMQTLSRSLGCRQGLLNLTKLAKTYYFCYLSCLILFYFLRAYGRSGKEKEKSCILRSIVCVVGHTTQLFELLHDYYVIATTLLLLFINSFLFFIFASICCFFAGGLKSVTIIWHQCWHQLFFQC